MKFLPREQKFLFLPKFIEPESEESEESDDGVEDESCEDGIDGEAKNAEKPTYFDDEGNEHTFEEILDDLGVDDDAESAEGDKSGIIVQEFTQKDYEAFLEEATKILILAPYIDKVELKSETCTRMHFDTQVDLRAAIPSKHNFKRHQRIKNKKVTDNDWYGADCRSGQDVVRLCNEGWKEGLDKIEDLISKINLDQIYGKKSTRKRIRGKHGSYFNIHAARSGKLDRAWKRSVRIETNKKISKAEIWLQIVGSANESASNLFWAPAAAIALAEFLQKKRLAVQIMCSSLQYGVFSSGRWGESLLTTACLKKFNNTSSLEELSMAAFAGNFRHYWFSAFCAVERKLSYGLGYPHDLKDELLPPVPKKCKRIIVPRFRTLTRATKWLNQEAKDILNEMANV